MTAVSGTDRRGGYRARCDGRGGRAARGRARRRCRPWRPAHISACSVPGRRTWRPRHAGDAGAGHDRGARPPPTRTDADADVRRPRRATPAPEGPCPPTPKSVPGYSLTAAPRGLGDPLAAVRGAGTCSAPLPLVVSAARPRRRALPVRGPAEAVGDRAGSPARPAEGRRRACTGGGMKMSMQRFGSQRVAVGSSPRRARSCSGTRGRARRSSSAAATPAASRLRARVHRAPLTPCP